MLNASGDRSCSHMLRSENSLNQLHDHHQVPTFAERIMDRGNVGMIESGLKLDLAKKSFILLGSLRCVRRDDLQRFHAPCDYMLDLVDFSHTTAAKPFNDP